MTDFFSIFNPQWVRVAALIIFITTYIGIASGRGFFFMLDRTGIVLLGAIAMLAVGAISLENAVKSVHYEAILMLFGLMVIAAQLHYSGLYQRLADYMVKALDKPPVFLAMLMASSGIMSAFLNNDVICLAFTPVAATALLRKKMNPVPYLIAIALSCNIGCAFTLIGNAQNVLLGQIAELPFGKYMLFSAIPVTIAMIGCYFIVLFLSRREESVKKAAPHPVTTFEEIPFNRWRAIKGTMALTGVVILCVASPLPQYLVVLTAAGLLLCSRRLYSSQVLQLVEWPLLLLFICLFVVVGSFINNGWGDELMRLMFRGGVDVNNPYVLTILGATASNLINNSAAVVLLSNLMDTSIQLNSAVLALTNAFAGNLLLFGSLANIIMVQSAQTLNIKISFGTFAKYGIPTALWSIAVILLWIFITPVFT